MQVKTVFATLLVAVASVQASPNPNAQFDDVKDFVNDAAGAAGSAFADGAAAVTSFVQEVAPKASEIAQGAESLFNEGVGKASDIIDDVRSKATEIASEAGALATGAADAFNSAASRAAGTASAAASGTATGSAPAASSSNNAGSLNKVAASIVVAGAGVVGIVVAL